MSSIETFEPATYDYINHSLIQGQQSITQKRPQALPKADGFLAVAGLYANLCASVKEKGFSHVFGDTGITSFGSGGFSNAVRISETGVAKLPRILQDSDEFDEERFYRDMVVELRVALHPPIRQHPNIISVEDVQWISGPNRNHDTLWNYMWPTLEFETASGTLTDLLRHGAELSFLEKMDLLYDVAKALDCIHDCGVVHSDIKPDNIFIFPHDQRRHIAKIADFGCSTILKKGQKRGRLSGGTKHWCAPEWREQLSHEELYKTDLYSFGLVIWYVVSDGTAPFSWLDSWSDSGPLSIDNIMNLKEDGCLLLTLAQQSLLELPLSEIEMEFVLELLNQTICEKDGRSEYVTPYFENYRAVFTAGMEQDEPNPEIGNKQFLEPIPVVDIKALMYKYHMDDRFRKQVFEALKEAAPSSETVPPAPLLLGVRVPQLEVLALGSISFQLFLCYYYGFGTKRNMEACVSALIKACTHGNTAAQGLIAQFHQAHGIELPSHLEVSEWLKSRVQRGGVGAAKMLKLLDPEEYQQTFLESRWGIPNNPLGVSHEFEALEMVEKMFSSYNRLNRHMIQGVERRIRYKTGHSLLHFAAAAGNVTVIKGLLDYQICDVNVVSLRGYGATPLWLACRGGHRKATLLLLSRLQAAPKTLMLRDGTPNSIQALMKNRHCLHYLSAFDSKDALGIATQLVRRIPDIINSSIPNAQGDLEEPLDKAVFEVNLESVKVLLALGARRTLNQLSMAACFHAGDILDLLLWDAADKGEILSREVMENLFYIASSQSNALSGIELHGFDTSYSVIRTFETLDYFTKLWHPEPWLDIQANALKALTQRRRLDVIQLVLEPIFKPCIRILSERYQHSVLFYTMRLGDMDMFSHFLEHGAADCACMDVVFSGALRNPNSHFVSELMRYGCMIDDRTNLIAGGGPKDTILPDHGMCPFSGAVLNACFDTATFMAKETGRIESEHTPWNLVIASVVNLCQFGTLGRLDYLLNLKEGPPPLPGAYGQNALHLLDSWWCVEPPKRTASLRQYLGKVVGKLSHTMDEQDDDGETPIFGAAMYHNVLLVEALIEAGASLNIKNNQGKTVLDMILGQRLMEVMRTNPDGSDPGPRDMTPRVKMIKENTDRGWKTSDGVAGINAGPADISTSVYRGDAYDNRLENIYSMIKAAGGTITSPHGFNSRTEDLVAWSAFWCGRHRECPLSEHLKGGELELVLRAVDEAGFDSDVDEVVDSGISDT